MEGLWDEMVATKRTLEDEELIKYIIADLDEEYTPLVTDICARAEPISLSEFYAQLLTFETHASLLQDGHARSTHAASRGGGYRGCGAGCGPIGCDYGGHGPSVGHNPNHFIGHGHGGQGCGRGTNQSDPVVCQVYSKKYHTNIECWHRFDKAYTQDQKFAHAMMNSSNVDSSWYMDSQATDHITDELEKLTARNKYQGGDQIHTASVSRYGYQSYWACYC
jgi:hypothetical protein